MDVCAYYSVIYNNWAFLEHPDWRMVPAAETSDGSFAGARYGHCCPNHPDYRAFALAQTEELLGRYRFDGIFFDMTFWPAICLCEHCRERFRAEVGGEIPTRIDWYSRQWCAFQLARERWMSELARDLGVKARTVCPGISVYHNFACALFSWTMGLSFKSAAHHDFLGADFYGDPLEQLFVSKFMLNLTENRPCEFMTSRCVNLRDHVRLKRYEEMETQAFAAAMFSSAFVFIDAVNVDGTVNPAIYERIGSIYEKTRAYEPYLGGESVEDVACYFSSDSKMDFSENGKSLADADQWNTRYPHLTALRGVCRVLQQAHLPFGVITRKQLPDLSRYRVVVLPNVLRMDAEEVEAFRNYVRQGGKLYASRYTSLTETCGVRHEDFMLADVFGCRFAGDDTGSITYLKPTTPAFKAAFAPQDYLSQFPQAEYLQKPHATIAGCLRLQKAPRGQSSGGGQTLATLTLPYAAGESGSVFDQNWASIHCSPPWEDTDIGVIVRHNFGEGTAIYSAADIESVPGEQNDRVFLALIRDLLGGAPTYEARTVPAVWMNVQHCPEDRCFLISFLNHPDRFPAATISGIPFTLQRMFPHKRRGHMRRNPLYFIILSVAKAVYF